MAPSQPRRGFVELGRCFSGGRLTLRGVTTFPALHRYDLLAYHVNIWFSLRERYFMMKATVGVYGRIVHPAGAGRPSSIAILNDGILSVGSARGPNG